MKPNKKETRGRKKSKDKRETVRLYIKGSMIERAGGLVALQEELTLAVEAKYKPSN